MCNAEDELKQAHAELDALHLENDPGAAVGLERRVDVLVDQLRVLRDEVRLEAMLVARALALATHAADATGDGYLVDALRAHMTCAPGVAGIIARGAAGSAKDASEAIRRHYAETIQDSMEHFADVKFRWSVETFGAGKRTAGVIQHIRKELEEVQRDPHDLEEWVDIILLAMDGYMRHGGKASDLAADLWTKHDINRRRKWPALGEQSQDLAVEHTAEAPADGTTTAAALGRVVDADLPF